MSKIEEEVALLKNQLENLANNISNKSTEKTINMSIEDYNNDMLNATYNGQGVIMNAVKDIIATGGANITVSENSPETLVEFINLVKSTIANNASGESNEPVS